MNLGPLQHGNVRLELLNMTHAEALLEHGRESSIWEHLPRSPLSDLNLTEEYISLAIDDYKNGTRLPFAIMDANLNRAIGSTSYGDIRKSHRSVEVGWTWLGVKYQKTEFNTLCKYLLLKNAFEDNDCIRVELKTDSRNIKSQRAIERIGAIKEGVHRNHMILPDGTLRDSVYYSIIDRDWPSVKEKFEAYISAL